MYKLGIFDFDGTLVDSAPGIVQVMRHCADEFQLSEEVFQHWTTLIGVPLLRQAEIILPHETPQVWMNLATRYREIYDVKTIELCPLFPDLLLMLDALGKAGVKISIASSKRRHLIEEVLEHHQLMDKFCLIVGAQDVENHKPHPESVQLTLEKLSVAAAESIVIGDSTYDLDMASGAGVDSIGVTTGVHAEEVLAGSRPTHIVSNLQEVARIILNGRAP